MQSADLTPPSPGTAEARRHPRARVDLLVQLRFGTMQEFLDATAEDLSVGGMFLRSAHLGPNGDTRKVGQLLALRFDAGKQRVVEGLGRVVHVQPPQPGRVPGVGIEFVHLDDDSLALVRAIVALKLA